MFACFEDDSAASSASSLHTSFFFHLPRFWCLHNSAPDAKERERGILSERKEGKKKGKRIGAIRKVKVKPQNMAREVEEKFWWGGWMRDLVREWGGGRGAGGKIKMKGGSWIMQKSVSCFPVPALKVSSEVSFPTVLRCFFPPRSLSQLKPLFFEVKLIIEYVRHWKIICWRITYANAKETEVRRSAPSVIWLLWVEFWLDEPILK